MNTATKKLTLICVILLVFGIVIGGAGFLMGGMKSVAWSLGGPKVYDENDPSEIVTIDETYDSFQNLDINVGYLSKITIKEGSAFSIKGQNNESFGGLTAKLENDTLIVKTKTGGIFSGGNIIPFNFGKHLNDNYVDITYPAGTKLSGVKLDSDLSDIEITGLAADHAIIGNASGDMKLTGIAGTELIIDNDLGDTLLENITESRIEIDNASGELTLKEIKGDALVIDTNLGDIHADHVTAGSADFHNASGDLSFTDFRTGALQINNSLGEIRINGILEGISTIKNANGDMQLHLDQPESGLSYDIDSDLGDIHVNGKTYSGSVKNNISGAKNVLKIETNLGDLTLTFKS